MEIKRSDREREKIYAIGKRNGLEPEDGLLLLALREIENGPRDSEYNILEVKGSGLETQTEYVVARIRKDRLRYVEYIKGDKPRISFIRFFVLHGERMDRPFDHLFVQETVDRIKKEFTEEEENGTDVIKTGNARPKGDSSKARGNSGTV